MSTTRPGARVRRAAAAVIAIPLLLAAAPAAAAEWRWSLTPYFWASEVGVDVSIDDHEVLEREVDLADLVDSLDFAIQAHLEGQRGAHGLFLDLTYADLGDDDRTYSTGGPLGAELVAKGDLETTLLEGGGIFDPGGDGTGFALLYGARLIDIDEEIDLRLELLDHTVRERRYSASTTLVDGLLGARLLRPMGERCSLLVRADLAAGGTELTWNALAGVGYGFGAGRSKQLFVGYRYMEIEFEESDRSAEIELQNKLGGFVVGLRFPLGGAAAPEAPASGQ